MEVAKVQVVMSARLKTWDRTRAVESALTRQMSDLETRPLSSKRARSTRQALTSPRDSLQDQSSVEHQRSEWEPPLFQKAVTERPAVSSGPMAWSVSLPALKAGTNRRSPKTEAVAPMAQSKQPLSLWVPRTVQRKAHATRSFSE